MRKAEVPADLPGPVRHRRVEATGADLAVVEVGDGDAPAVLIAHGAGSSARFVCAAFAGAVVASGRRLVTYDLRGHGSSTPTADRDDHHLDVHVADLIEVAFDMEADVEVVGGVSLGGHAAVRMVASGAMRPSVVLACLPAWTGAAQPGVGPHAAVAAEVREAGIAGVLERLRSDTQMPRWLQETVVADYSRHDAASLAASLLALDDGEAPGEAELTSLSVPLASVGWPDDPAHPLEVAQTWARMAPSSAFGRACLTELDGDVGALGRVALSTVADALRSRSPRRSPLP